MVLVITKHEAIIALMGWVATEPETVHYLIVWALQSLSLSCK